MQLVSIIIPTYNRGNLISETLDSILNQTYQNWECIIVDDRSTDNTKNVIKSYCLRDNRFRFYERPKNRQKGACACRNYGFELSRGEFLQWLDSDDLISLNKIEVQVKVLKNKKSNDIVYSKWSYFSDRSNLNSDVKNPSFYKNYKDGFSLMQSMGYFETFIASHCFLINRKIIDKVGLWNEQLSINQDGDFFNRILLICNKVYFSENVIAYYRKNVNTSISSYSSKEKVEKLIFSWKLIESRMNIKYSNKNFIYTKNAKMAIFILLGKSNYSYVKYFYKDYFSELLDEERKNEIKHRFDRRVIRKIKKMIR